MQLVHLLWGYFLTSHVGFFNFFVFEATAPDTFLFPTQLTLAFLAFRTCEDFITLGIILE